MQDFVNQLSSWSDILAEESSYKGMLRKFGEAMANLCGAISYGAFQFDKENHLQPIELKCPNLASVDTATTAYLERLIQQDPGIIVDFKRGMISLDIHGNNCGLCALATANTEGGFTFILWQAPRIDGAAEGLLNILIKQIQKDAAWFQKLEDTQSMLYRDELTDLYNNRYFEIAIDNELRRNNRFESKFCVLFIDLDDFKPINDTHGHLSGSSVLTQVAAEIRSAIRDIDIPIRYGGDEFVVMLLGATATKGTMVAERIRQRIANKAFVMEDGSKDHITACIGVAAFPDHGSTREELLKIADSMMYQCKKAGKNRVSILPKSSTDKTKTLQAT